MMRVLVSKYREIMENVKEKMNNGEWRGSIIHDLL
jgi:hypothetical protein